MVGAEHRDAAIVQESTAQLADAQRGVQKILRRASAQSTDEPGPHEVNLFFEVLTAIGGLVWQRRAVGGRTAFQNVTNVDVFPLHPARHDDPVEQLPCWPNERLALPVFVGARRFTHETNVRVELADAKHRLGARRDELAAPRTRLDAVGEKLKRLPPFFERHGGLLRFGIVEQRRPGLCRGDRQRRRRRERQPFHASRAQAIEMSSSHAGHFFEAHWIRHDLLGVNVGCLLL